MSLIEKIESLLHASGVTYKQEKSRGSDVFRLAPPPGADYRFTLYVYGDGEPQICTDWVGTEQIELGYYHPFEIDDYDSHEERNQAFMDALQELIRLPSRIRYTPGLLIHWWTCEVRSEDSWRDAGGGSGRLNWPWRWLQRKIRGYARVYHSPALGVQNSGNSSGSE